MFPAYKIESSAVAPNKDFLSNPSYDSIPVTSETIGQIISSDSDSSDSNELNKVQEYKKPPSPPKTEYCYYEDLDRKKEYLKLTELPFRAVPYYKIRRDFKRFGSQKKFKRYFNEKRVKKLLRATERLLDEKVDKDEEMRIHLIKNPQEVDKWIEYCEYKELSSKPTTPREQTEKIKLEVIEKALYFNPGNSELMKMYLNLISIVHPPAKVANLIEDLIAKDPYNNTYWKHLLNNHQSSMSCEVENALKLYEKAMNTLRKRHDSDPQMLILFKNCCQFLRQCGLNEQFFAIIQLVISLNVNSSSELEKLFFAKEIQNVHLREYEELVLKSDLPMNELWYRMEILRSICNFLPVKTSPGGQIEDPQRFVFNEDICNLVNPLKNSSYKFDLFIIIMRLLKCPLPFRSIKHEFFTIEDREMECGVEFLSVLLDKAVNSNSFGFQKILYSVAKDLNVAPNFFNFNVEYEPYFDLVSNILVICSNSFNDHQNKIVLIIWLRLQRLMIIADQLKMSLENKEKNTSDIAKYKKQIKSKVKSVLKSSKHQNDLNILCEYALIEKTLGDVKASEAILAMAIDNGSSSNEIDLYQIAMESCEMKLTSGNKAECVEILKKIAGDSRNLTDFFASKIEEEADREETEIEDYFLPKTNKFNFIKAKIYFLLASISKRAALDEILRHINVVSSSLQEKLYELYVWIFHLKIVGEDSQSLKSYLEVAAKALLAFPRNIFILYTIAGHSSLRWFDVKKLLLKTPTTESLFFLLLASKYCEEKFSDDTNALMYKHRIYHTIDNFVTRRCPGINSILTWRLYLRAAFNYDFSKCKRILYQTLDNNPMLKQIYLDGARYLPEEHSQLLDLIVEKGLRVHALAEELEILRKQEMH